MLPFLTGAGLIHRKYFPRPSCNNFFELSISRLPKAAAVVRGEAAVCSG